MRRAHEDGAVVAVEVVQQRRERLVEAHVARDVAVAGRRRGHAQRDPAVGGVAHAAVLADLAAHAVGAAAQAVVGHRADHQRELQDQLLAAGDVHIDLNHKRREETRGNNVRHLDQ